MAKSNKHYDSPRQKESIQLSFLDDISIPEDSNKSYQIISFEEYIQKKQDEEYQATISQMIEHLKIKE